MFHADAFAAVPYTGNPAAVVLVQPTAAWELSDGAMRAIAAEMNLSETAFIIAPPRDEDDDADGKAAGTAGASGNAFMIDGSISRAFVENDRFRLRWFTPQVSARRPPPRAGLGRLAGPGAAGVVVVVVDDAWAPMQHDCGCLCCCFRCARVVR